MSEVILEFFYRYLSNVFPTGFKIEAGNLVTLAGDFSRKQ